MGERQAQDRVAGTGVQQRAVSLAHRMLSGAASASCVAYRLDGQPTVDALAHGLSASGALMVAAVLDPATQPTPLRAPGRGIEVRVDLSKYAPESRVEILGASAHMLGVLEWLDEPVAARALQDPEVPERVRAVGSAPHGQIGVVHVERVMLHDGAGATALSFRHVIAHHDAARERGVSLVESVALDVATGVDRTDLAVLCDAAEHGWIDSCVLSERPGGQGCSHTLDQDFVVDVDLTGLTVMRNGARAATVFFIPFARTPQHARDLPAAVRSLCGEPHHSYSAS